MRRLSVIVVANQTIPPCLVSSLSESITPKVPPTVTHVSGAVQHDTSGELDVKAGGKEMENQQSMMMMFERMLQEHRAMSEVGAAVEWLVQRHGQFNDKDVSCYLHDHKSEMLRCGISEGLQAVYTRMGSKGVSILHSSNTLPRRRSKRR